MINIRFLLCCFVFCCVNLAAFSQKNKKEKDEPVFCYSLDELKEYRSIEENNSAYPSINIPLEQLANILLSVAVYPEFPKQKFLQQTVWVKVSFNDNGRITKTGIEKPMYPTTDSTAIFLIRATDTYWNPAMQLNRPESSTVTIPVRFSPHFDTIDNICYFGVSLFVSELTVFIDNTNTYPACFHPDVRDSVYFSDRLLNMNTSGQAPHRTHMYRQLPSYSATSGCFGTIRLGCNVDTNGNVSNVQLVHPICESLNQEALKDFKEMHGCWKPARYKGNRVDSYAEFDIQYDELGKHDFIHRTVEKLSYAAKMDGYEYIQNKKFEKAIACFKKACNYYIDDIELQYHLVLLYIHENKAEEACSLLSVIKSTAIDKGYTVSVTESEINKLSTELCGE